MQVTQDNGRMLLNEYMYYPAKVFRHLRIRVICLLCSHIWQHNWAIYISSTLPAREPLWSGGLIRLILLEKMFRSPAMLTFSRSSVEPHCREFADKCTVRTIICFVALYIAFFWVQQEMIAGEFAKTEADLLIELFIWIQCVSCFSNWN